MRDLGYIIVKLTLIMIVLLNINGCATQNKTSILQRELKDPDNGLVAFTVQANPIKTWCGKWLNGALSYTGEASFQTLMYNYSAVPIKFDGKRYAFVLSLAAGQQHFDELWTGMIFAKDYTPINFNVVPGQITYIGNINIDYEGDYFFTRIRNDWPNDLAVFENRLPNVSPDKYRIDTMGYPIKNIQLYKIIPPATHIDINLANFKKTNNPFNYDY